MRHCYSVLFMEMVSRRRRAFVGLSLPSCCGSALRSWIEFLDLQYDVHSSSKVAAGMADLVVGVLLLLLLRGQWNDAEAVLFLQWPHYLCCRCCVDYVGAGYDAMAPFLC
ncbi:hypothetical protein Nepgr_020411 [Nepenthes gracilis]|uniref:Uncharacterized protein n=1 Tax=Nepenthes gracilis TaxID=150966 RepID=A0AAD3XW91_NEPGR|nr:hypothetical protein Nepgr_020411 [Nepenthes gracilis]